MNFVSSNYRYYFKGNIYDFDKMNKNEYFNGIIPEIENKLKACNKYLDFHFWGVPSIVNPENVPPPGFKWSQKEIKDIKQKYRNESEKFQNLIKSEKNIYGSLEWKRITDLITNFDDENYRNYPLKQGFLGNCYLISFLRGMLSFRPKEYYELFSSYLFDIGYFEVRLYVDDGNKKKPKKVFVDDYILFDLQKNTPYFSYISNNNHHINRFLLIEKAFAKFFGSYYNIRE